MTATPPPRTLAEHLRALPDEDVAALVRLRPDLSTPVPADLEVLAARAQVRLSVARALEQLDRFSLEVLDAVRLLAPPAAGLPDLLALTAGAAPDEAVWEAVSRLRALAVVWGTDDSLHVVRTVDDVSSPYPAGLGRPVRLLLSARDGGQVAPVLHALGLGEARQPRAAELVAEAFGEPSRLAGLLEAAADGARTVLERLAVGGLPLGSVQGAARTVRAEDADSPVDWLLARALLVATDDETVELPREVGLLLRGARPLGDLHPRPPVPLAPVRQPSDVDAAGTGQVLEALRLTEAVLEACAAEPAGVLRAGGLGVRDLRRVARQAGVSEAVATLLLEVARAAELLGESGEAEAVWLPTTTYDSWRTEPAEQRWARLARGWLGMARLPGLVGRRDDRDRLLAPLSADLERASAPDTRRQALGALARVVPGVAPAADDVVALVAWYAPRRGGRHRDDAVRWALDEAATLGVTGRGALTSAARALLGGEDPAPVLAKTLPVPLDTVLVQADLTVVAPGPIEADLAAELGLVADVESAGGATVYRVTPASVRRALDAGRTAADLHALFATRSSTPVPQALTYLVDDVARRHGGLRAGTASAYLRSDDETLLAAILADRRCDVLDARRLAPTVLVARAPVARMLEVLRAAGYAPMAEDPSGAVLLGAPQARRAPVRPRSSRPAPGPQVLDEAMVAEVVRTLRRADAAAREQRRAGPAPALQVPGVTTATTLAVLQQAARERHRVALGYVDAHGGTAARVVRPLSLGAGYLRAEDDRTEILHTFALHRITSAALVEE